MKSGHYMTVKLALNSKEEYNLDQEVCSAMFLFLNARLRKSPKSFMHFYYNAARAFIYLFILNLVRLKSEVTKFPSRTLVVLSVCV